MAKRNADWSEVSEPMAGTKCDRACHAIGRRKVVVLGRRDEPASDAARSSQVVA